MVVGFLTQPELGRQHALLQLVLDVGDLYRQPGRVQTPGRASHHAVAGRLQGFVLHQVYHERGDFQVRIHRLDGHQGGPEVGPAADQVQVSDAVAVGTGVVDQEQGDVGGGAVGGVLLALQGVQHRLRGHAPFLGGFVVAVQIQPDAPGQFLTRLVVFEDDGAGVIEVAVQDAGHVGGKVWVVGVGVHPLGAVVVGPAHLAEGIHHHQEAGFFELPQGQRLVVVVAGGFLGHEAQGHPDLFQDCQIDVGTRRVGLEAIQYLVDLFEGHRGIGQG